MGLLGALFNNFSGNLFFKACKYGDIDQVDKMLAEDGSLVDKNDKNGCSGLLYAAANGHNRVVSSILKRSPKLTINMLEPLKGGSPLLAASTNGYLEIVRMLLENGADPNTYNFYGIPPLHNAVHEEQELVVAALLMYGADPHKKDNLQNTPIDLAQRGHNQQIKNVLLEIR